MWKTGSGSQLAQGPHVGLVPSNRSTNGGGSENYFTSFRSRPSCWPLWERTGEGSGSTGETGTACCGGGRGASSHRAPLVPQKLWGCRWRRPLPSSSSGRFVRVAAALVYPSFFSISVSNPLSSFVLSRLQPYPSPRRSPSFLVFDRPRAYIHERAVVFSENFGGPALRPRARRPGACLRGIAPGSRSPIT